MMNDDERVMSRLLAWCPECQAALKIKFSYPFRTNTMRIEALCDYYSRDDRTGEVWRCNWDGIYMELKE
jgi:hypothetical protein